MRLSSLRIYRKLPCFKGFLKLLVTKDFPKFYFYLLLVLSFRKLFLGRRGRSRVIISVEPMTRGGTWVHISSEPLHERNKAVSCIFFSKEVSLIDICLVRFAQKICCSTATYVFVLVLQFFPKNLSKTEESAHRLL